MAVARALLLSVASASSLSIRSRVPLSQPLRAASVRMMAGAADDPAAFVKSTVASDKDRTAAAAAVPRAALAASRTASLLPSSFPLRTRESGVCPGLPLSRPCLTFRPIRFIGTGRHRSSSSLRCGRSARCGRRDTARVFFVVEVDPELLLSWRHVCVRGGSKSIRLLLQSHVLPECSATPRNVHIHVVICFKCNN